MRLVFENAADGNPDEARNDERRRRQIASELIADSHGLDRIGVTSLGDFEPGLDCQKAGDAARVLNFRQAELYPLEPLDILQLIVPVAALSTGRFAQVVVGFEAVDDLPHFVAWQLL